MSNRNKKRKNKVKLTEIEQMMEVLPIGSLGLTRYTYDSWMRCYPESNHEEYKDYQEPEDLMQYLANYLNRSFPHKRPKADLPISLKLIDDDYFKWLGDKTNDENSRSSYQGTDHEAEKIHAANLGVTRWLLGIPVVGVTEAEVIDTRLSREVTDEIRGFLQKTFPYPGYSFYVAPYMIESANLYANQNHVMQMAAAWFDKGVNVVYGKFDEIRNNSPMTLTVSMIPVVVQLKHDLDNIRVGDVLFYMDEKFPEYDEFAKNSALHNIFDILLYDDSKVNQSETFKYSKAGEGIVNWAQGKILNAGDDEFKETLKLFMISAADFSKFYDAVMGVFIDELKDDVKVVYK